MLAALLAGGVTLSMLSMLAGGGAWKQHAPANRTAVLVHLRLSAVDPTARVSPQVASEVRPSTRTNDRSSGRPVSDRAPKRVRAGDRSTAPESIDRSTPMSSIATDAAAAAQAAELPGLSPDQPASAPLRLDSATIRAASRQSVGAVRRLAGASGQALPEASPHGGDPLATRIQQSVKPDCLAPSAQASLLAIPAIAFAALMDKCN